MNRPCMTRTTRCLHRTSSSCNSYEGGWFPSVPSRSGVAPTPDRKLDTIRKSAIAPLGVLRVTYQAHHNALVNRTKTRHHMRLGKTWRTLLPQVGAEDLNQTNLEGGDLSVHEDTGQIKLDLETDVYICAIDSRAPPQRKPSVGGLVQTGSLGVREILVSRRLVETGRLLPEQTLSGREMSALG